MKSIILINCELGKESKIITMLNAMSVASESHQTFGAYDIVAELETEDLQTMQENVTFIRKNPFIRSTMTLNVVNHAIKVEAS